MSSFRIEKAPARNSSFATPGENYVILATSEAVRKQLTDSYWCEAMDQVCDGKLVGVAVRYTGENLVMLQFRPKTISPAGYRYPLFMSIPIEFMVPRGQSAINLALSDLRGSFSESGTGSFRSSTSSQSDLRSNQSFSGTGSDLPKLCVVCGRFNMPNMVSRPHGWKCKECKGTKSVPKLRVEAEKLQAALAAAK